MPKLSKNYIIVITLLFISLILGGTFLAITQRSSGQNLVLNSSQSSPSLQNSSLVSSSISSSNSQNSYSFSSSQVSISIQNQINSTNSSINENQQSLDSSSSSQNSSPSSPSNQQSNLKTYTNPNYPNFKLNYDNSWKMEEKTSQSNFEGLMNREIILTKDETLLTFRLEIGLPVDGSGGDPKYSVAQTGLFYRLIDKDNKFDYSSENKSFIKENIIGKIKTNLKVSDFADYKNSPQIINDENYIISSVYATLEGSDQKTLSEADQIVADSSFGESLR